MQSGKDSLDNYMYEQDKEDLTDCRVKRRRQYLYHILKQE